MGNHNDIYITCGHCHRRLKYSELLREPSWNGKWMNFITPCCHDGWSSTKDELLGLTYLMRSMREVR